MQQTILIIEDDKFLRELMEKKLKQAGFNVDTAIDGEIGFDMIKQSSPDLILLDLLLPSMSGWEVLEAMKKDSSISSIPVLILTNLGEKNDVEKGLQMGAQDYIIKAHYTPNEIVDKVKKYLPKQGQ